MDPLPSYKIRTATWKDLHLLCEFGARSFAASFAADNTPEDLAAYLTKAFSPEQISKELHQAGNHFLLVDTGQAIIGYAKTSKSNPPPCVPGNHPLELERIYVAQQWIGRGLGGELLQTIVNIATASGQDTLWLGVWQKNPRAIKFYKRWGFKIVGDKKFSLGADLQDDYVLARSLI